MRVLRGYIKFTVKKNKREGQKTADNDTAELCRKLCWPIIRVKMIWNGMAVKINQKGLN